MEYGIKENGELVLGKSRLKIDYSKEYGGWASDQMINFWERYIRTVFNRYKGKVKYYLTFNEVNNMNNGNPLHAAGVLTIKDPKYPDDARKSITDQDKWQAYYHLCVANALTVKIGHEIDPSMKVGCMLTSSCVAVYPMNPDPENVFGAYEKQRMSNFVYGDPFCKGIIPGYVKRLWKELGLDIKMDEEGLAMIKKYTVDFFSFSYYRSSVYDKGVVIGNQK